MSANIKRKREEQVLSREGNASWYHDINALPSFSTDELVSGASYTNIGHLIGSRLLVSVARTVRLSGSAEHEFDKS